jgi:hypothetical protein
MLGHQIAPSKCEGRTSPRDMQEKERIYFQDIWDD